MDASIILEWCNPWPRCHLPYLCKPAVVIVTSFSLWRLAPSRRSVLRRRSQPPFSSWCHSHCDVIHYWAGHAHHYGCKNVRTDTLPCLIYKDLPGGINVALNATHASFRPPEPTTQMTSRLVQPCLHSSWHSVVKHAGEGSSPQNHPFPLGIWTPI